MDSSSPPKKCMEIIESSEVSECHRTFVLHGESHTLGNALHYMLSKNPHVAYSGYNRPHPTEDKINVRIQSTDKPAMDLLQTALRDVRDSCQHVHGTLQTTFSQFKESQSEGSS